MDKREQLEAMDKFLRELDDIKNSETSVLKKITSIEAENINVGIGMLDKLLPDIHEASDKLIEEIDKVILEFTDHRDKFVKDNKLEATEQTPAE